MPRDGFPIIRLEVEGMRHTILHAMTDHSARMSTEIRKAVDAYCTPENIQSVVHAEVSRTLDAVIKEEVSNFFRYGDGRKAVAAGVKKRLLGKRTMTMLDEV